MGLVIVCLENFISWTARESEAVREFAFILREMLKLIEIVFPRVLKDANMLGNQVYQERNFGEKLF